MDARHKVYTRPVPGMTKNTRTGGAYSAAAR